MKAVKEDKLISKMFSLMPRKRMVLGGKEEVWQKVASHIRDARLQQERERSLPAWQYLFLPRTLLRIGTTTLIVILALSVVGGAASAQPGETLYPVKIAAESVEMVLATGDEAKVKVGIKHAKRRLAEVKTLVAGNGDTETVQETLEALTAKTDAVIEVAANSQENADLAVQAAELATEQEIVLSSLGDSATEEIKEAVANTIAAAKESINKLSGEVVEGATASAEEAPVTATSTAILATPVPAAAKPQPSHEIEANIQLDQIIIIGEDNEPQVLGN